MTIGEAIAKINSIKPNTYKSEEKIYWLSKLDGMITEEILHRYCCGESATFDGYTPDTALDTVLLVPSPFDDLYIKWLEAQIDYASGEYSRYNNSITAYNTAFSEYAKNYNRTHMPKACYFKF